MVVDNPELSRFELRVGEDLGIADYKKDGDTIAFTHTKVPEHLEGHGMGSELARSALESARRQNLKVVPACPFIAAYIEKNPEYKDLLASPA